MKNVMCMNCKTLGLMTDYDIREDGIDYCSKCGKKKILITSVNGVKL